VIGFGRDLKLAPALEKSLARLTTLTGGTVHVLPGAVGAAAALDAVRAHSDSQVLLELVPTVEQLKPGLHPLTITLPDDPGTKLVHRASIHVK
jgi:predicted dinucleotide-utilizing enzyme